ncbi:MAG: thioredoxin-disulfide reductase [Bacteroidales bacterium]|nr:thioredoxin-disulfide reductase [Bacteroidales bacterium]
MKDVIIIGSGPAGFTAAIYACRSGLSVSLYEGLQPGGQLTTTTIVENYPGFENGIDSYSLMDSMRNQALRFGAEIICATVTACDFSGEIKSLTLDSGEIVQSKAVIIATGASAKYLGLESEERYKGQGVSACATCDGFFYKKKVVAVVGGGDTACEEASYLAGLCNKVYMIVRRDVLRASEAMQERVKSIENIEILWNCQTQEVLGDQGGVTGARLIRKNGEVFDIEIAGFFLAIGHHPNSDIFKEWVETDDKGYIVTKAPYTLTSCPGVFAAGDVADPDYRQAVVAAASGAKAAIDAKKYLSE